MNTVKINDLPKTSNVEKNDLLIISQGHVTKTVAVKDLLGIVSTDSENLYNFPLSVQMDEPKTISDNHIWVKADNAQVESLYLSTDKSEMTNNSLLLTVDINDVVGTVKCKKGDLDCTVRIGQGDEKEWKISDIPGKSQLTTNYPTAYKKSETGVIDLLDIYCANKNGWDQVGGKDCDVALLNNYSSNMTKFRTDVLLADGTLLRDNKETNEESENKLNDVFISPCGNHLISVTGYYPYIYPYDKTPDGTYEYIGQDAYAKQIPSSISYGVFRNAKITKGGMYIIMTFWNSPYLIVLKRQDDGSYEKINVPYPRTGYTKITVGERHVLLTEEGKACVAYKFDENTFEQIQIPGLTDSTEFIQGCFDRDNLYIMSSTQGIVHYSVSGDDLVKTNLSYDDTELYKGPRMTRAEVKAKSGLIMISSNVYNSNPMVHIFRHNKSENRLVKLLEYDKSVVRIGMSQGGIFTWVEEVTTNKYTVMTHKYDKNSDKVIQIEPVTTENTELCVYYPE